MIILYVKQERQFKLNLISTLSSKVSLVPPNKPRAQLPKYYVSYFLSFYFTL